MDFKIIDRIEIENGKEIRYRSYEPIISMKPPSGTFCIEHMRDIAHCCEEGDRYE